MAVPEVVPVKHPVPTMLILLALLIVSGPAGASTVDHSAVLNAAGFPSPAGPVTQAVQTMTVDPGERFELSGTITRLPYGLPYQGTLNLQEQPPGGTFQWVDTTSTATDGSYTFGVSRSVPGVYRYRVEIPGFSMSGDEWSVTVRGTPTTPAPTPTTIMPAGQYSQARAYYQAAGVAWSQAWGASDIVLIRQYLGGAKAAYTNCLSTANAVNDPANAANLALLRTISSAYIDLADAALAMYDGADVYGAGRSQMSSSDYAAAATSFGDAAAKFEASKMLFAQATTTLQSVVYTGTEFGDGTAYTSAIVPILNAKGDYMGEFSTYAAGWQHTALAFQAMVSGDQATFQSEAGQAMGLFAALRTSAAFSADASSNYDILAALAGGVTPAPTPTPTPTVTMTPMPPETVTPVPTVTKTPAPTITNTPVPTATKTPVPTATTAWSFEGPWLDTTKTYFWFMAPEGNTVRGGWESGMIAGESEGSFTGTLSNGGKVLSGPFETMFQGGNFRFTLTDANHFTGYMDSPSGKVSLSCTRMGW